MRQLKGLFLAVLLLTFVAGVGAGAWVESLVAAPRYQSKLDRRVDDFRRHFDLTPTQIRQLRDILAEHDHEDDRIRGGLTPEQYRAIRTLEARSRERIRDILTEAQQEEYDRLTDGR